MAPELSRDSMLFENNRAISRLRSAGNSLIRAALLARYQRVMALAGCAVSFGGVLPPPANGDSTPNTPWVGISTNDILTPNAQEANSAASDIQQLGATAVRVFYYINKGTAWDNYKVEICNAAQAAESHGLQLIVAFEGVDNGVGYYPQGAKQTREFIKTADSVLWDLASENGCTPNVKNYIFEVNEENNPTLNHNLTDPSYDGPEQTALLDSKLSRTLQIDAAKPEINATVGFADSLAEANHDSATFLEQQGQALQAHSLTNPYKYIDVHPYPANPTSDPTDTINRLTAADNATIKTFFPGSQLTFGEYGVNTKVPLSLAGSYNTIPATNGVSIDQQTSYDTNFLNATKSSPWRTIFDYKDHGGGSMPSAGLKYINGATKPSYSRVKAQIQQQTGRY